MADFCLSHCNIVLLYSESAQKTANGKIRPTGVIFISNSYAIVQKAKPFSHVDASPSDSEKRPLSMH